jgi:hypothetical protein
MRFRVYVLRHRGRRLPWRDVINGPRYVGDLVTHHVTVGEERFEVAELRGTDAIAPPPIPPLYEPVLLGFAPLAFRLRGIERVQRGGEIFAVVQEWHCELP